VKAETLRNQLSDEMIQSMTLERRPLDELPAASGNGSRTEYVALHYQEHLIEEQQEREREISWLRAEMAEVEEKVALYDAVMGSLSEAEVFLVRLHYDEALSFPRIAEMNTLSDIPWIQSVSTMKRMNANILRKVNEVLGPSLPASAVGFNWGGERGIEA
jgi:hypothetical protein